MTETKLKKILEEHEKWLNGEGGCRADLRDADIRRADLRGINLSGANLSGANLRGVDLRDSDLRNTKLSYTDLTGANLENSKLADSDLSYADLSYADLSDTNLEGANLKRTNLKGADLDYSCMPLWCGDLKANYDEVQMIQQLYHVLSHVKYSDNSSDRLKEILLKDEIVALANEFHRVGECGEITKQLYKRMEFN